MLLFAADNGARQDTDAVGDPQAVSESCELRSQTLVIGADDGQLAGPSARERGQKPIQPLLPAEPAEKQNERLLRGNRLDGCSDFTGAWQRVVDPIGNHSQPGEQPTEALKLRGFELRRQVDCSRVLDVRPLDETDPHGFRNPAAPSD